MRTPTSLALVALAAAFLGGATAPRNGQLTGSQLLNNADAEPSRRVHTVGDVWMSVGSDGVVGGQYDAIGADPDSAYAIESSFEFPGGSERDHLYGSGLWIGGLVGGVDTLVIAAMKAGSGPNPVFTPTRPIRTSYNPILGHQRFEAHYADTALTGYRDPANRSLGMEIRQTSHAFESPPYDRFVIVEYLIRNISRQTIYKVHVGFFADPDVFSELRSGQPESGPADDLTGFLRDRGIAYTIDNDGDAEGVPDSLFARNWCPSGLGLAPVMMDPLPACTSFNWWATNFGDAEWGPSRTIPNYHSRVVGEPVLPGNMSQMYRAMANREIDYDQIDAAIDKSAEGWRKPAIAQADHIANGLDTRWTLSYCFGNLAPYDSLRLVMAYVVGDSIHTTPGRYPDPSNPDTFAIGLDFTDLRRNVDLARWAWGHQFALADAAPLDVRLEPKSDTSVRISWRPAPFPEAAAYAIFRRTVGRDTLWEFISEVAPPQYEWLDCRLKPSSAYEYSVASKNLLGVLGGHSRPKRITLGHPPTPVIKARNDRGAIVLTWSDAAPLPEFAPITYLTIYRGTPGLALSPYLRIPILKVNGSRQGTAQSEFDPSSAPPWRDLDRGTSHVVVDDSVTPAVRYEYQARLSNSLGLESKMSNRTFATPMIQNRRGLILLGGSPTSNSLVDEALQFEFYGSWAEKSGFDTAKSVIPRSLYRDSLLSLKHLSLYECVIVVSEDMSEYGLLYSPIRALQEYSQNGGKCIFALRNHGLRSMFGWPYYHVPFPLQSLIGVISVHKEIFYNSRKWLRGEFTAAMPSDASYNRVDADSAEGWDFTFLEELAATAESVYASGYIPAVGALGSIASDAEVLYEYESADTASSLHGKPIAVRRITDSSAAILFNFPLSLMKHEQAWQALTQAVADLGVDTTNYWPPTQSTTHSIINWLYGSSESTPNPAWDTNRDGVTDIRDVVEALQRR